MPDDVSCWPTIDDVDDPRLAPLRDLRSGGRGPDALLVIEGGLAVARALAGPLAVRAVVGTVSQLGRLDAAMLPTEVWQVSASLLREVVGFDFHRGVIALAQRPPPEPPWLDALLGKPQWTAVVLERLADPANVGAVIRTAAALGVEVVVCDPAGADPFGRRALRASMGHALVRTPWVADLAATVGRLAACGAQVLAATTADDAVALPDVVRAPRTVILLGNEGAGLSDALLAASSARVTIPIAAGSDSLNVAAAAAIMLYGLRGATRPDP